MDRVGERDYRMTVDRLLAHLADLEWANLRLRAELARLRVARPACRPRPAASPTPLGPGAAQTTGGRP